MASTKAEGHTKVKVTNHVLMFVLYVTVR